jgi:molybdopterin-guanine dinucleotide biosynthesis protein A
MPFLNFDLLRFMILQAPGHDVVMPRIGEFYEPLHAVYARRCLPSIERSIAAGQRRVLHALAGAKVRYLDEDEIARYDPEHLSFFNVNTPEDLLRMQEMMRGLYHASLSAASRCPGQCSEA